MNLYACIDILYGLI